MAMRRIKKDDEVIVIAGKDKGRQGKVLRVIDGNYVIVEGINRVKKHQKPNPQKGIQGGIIDKETPLHVSNVALFDAVSKKPSRIGFKTLEDGRKVRYLKSNNEMVDV